MAHDPAAKGPAGNPTSVTAVDTRTVEVKLPETYRFFRSAMARAEALPLADGAVDAALAVLTVHHWTEPARGLAELVREVAPGR